MTVKVMSEGISYNSVEICKANEEDLDSTPCNNEPKEDDFDRVCVSVPYKICENQKITARLQDGLSNIQWYKNGVKIDGSTNSGLEISSAGDFTYTATLADCPVSGCCPIRVILIDCCKPDVCVPFVIVPSLINKK
jgi:hypothetical protein